MPSLEDLIAILKNQKKDDSVTWTPSWKGMLIVVFILSITVFYESERINNYIKNINKVDTSIEKTFQGFFMKQFAKVIKQIEMYKTKIGLADFQRIEKKLISFLREPIILFQEDKLDKQVSYIGSAKSPFSQGKVIHKTDQAPVTSKTSPSPKVKNKKKLAPPFKVLMIGDSMMGGYVGISLQKEIMKIPHSRVIRKGIVSSSLNWWIYRLRRYLKMYKPNVIIIMIGTNDYYTNKYKKRTLTLMNLLKKNRLLAFWIGLPVMERKKLNTNVIKINSTHEKSSQSFNNIHYINTWTLFDKNQRFIKNKKGHLVRLRARDGVHLGRVASKWLSDYVLKYMSNYMEI